MAQVDAAAAFVTLRGTVRPELRSVGNHRAESATVLYHRLQPRKSTVVAVRTVCDSKKKEVMTTAVMCDLCVFVNTVTHLFKTQP